MLPKGRLMKPSDEDSTYTTSGVMLLLFDREGELELVMIRRPATMKNHAGQIAFPGGKKEEGDATVIDTAYRETYEEIGVLPENIEYIATLSPVYVQVSNFMITPVLGWCKQPPHFRVDSTEVEELILIPVRSIIDKDSYVYRDVETKAGLLSVPGYEIDSSFIWGASGMILSELIDLIQ